MSYLESVDNALRLLTLLSREEELGVTETAHQLGISPSTSHRLLTTLKYREFVTQTDQRTYRKGAAFLALSNVPVRKVDLVSVARPAMEALRTRLDETCHLMVRVHRNVRFLASVEADHALRVSSRAGAVLPAHQVSGGKALLAELSTEEFLELYPATGVPEASLDSAAMAVLRREIDVARRRGYAVSQGETERGIAAVGVCLPDGGRVPAGALSVSVPTVRYTAHRVPEIVSALRVAVQAIARDLG